MSEKINSVPAKLLEARDIIKSTKITKEGRNDYSSYDYFTPSQVSNLVDSACQEVGLLPTFNMEKDELGFFGRLVIIDVETGNTMESIMRTAIPDITATNSTQKMGGAYTFTKRYMYMNDFDITDNNLDFDSQDNRTSKQKEVSESRPKSFLKKKTMDSDKKTEENNIAPEKSELDELRAQCDELDIKYTKRHKEDGLKKLIKEYVSKDTPYEAAEESDMDTYLSKIEDYESKDELMAEANDIINDAEACSLSKDEVDKLKEQINIKFKSL